LNPFSVTKKGLMSAVMILLHSKEDIIMVMKPYCTKCLNDKLSIIQNLGEVSNNEISDLRHYGVRLVRVKCACFR
jgi:hypothetical protein